MKKYLNHSDYTFEKMNKASVACGPLVKWAIAQVSYAEMLQKVDPLRKELQKNEGDMLVNQSKVWLEWLAIGSYLLIYKNSSL